MSCNPVFIVRLDLVPVSGATTVIRASVRPYDTSDGFVRGGIVRFGDIRQSMSDRNGSPVANAFDCEFFDRDGSLRALLDDGNTQYLTWQDVTVLFGTREDIRAGGTADYPLFRGQLVDPNPGPKRAFSIGATSRMGTKKGPYDNDQEVNKVTGARALLDGFASMPRGSYELAIPALWGEKTTFGLTNAQGEDVDIGAVTAVNLGPLPGSAPEFLSAPTWGTPQKYLDGSPVSLATDLGGQTYTFIFGARTADGQWSLSAPLTIAGLPASNAFESDGSGHRGFGTGVELFINPYTDPDELAQITNPLTSTLMGNLWVKVGAADAGTAYHHVDGAGEAYTVGFDVNGDDSFFKAFGPALPGVPLAQINPLAGDFWAFLRHPGIISRLFLSDLGGGEGLVLDETENDTPPGREAKYAPITTADIANGSVNLGPGTGYVATIGDHYYFGVILNGAKGKAARDGSFPPRANICGYLINQAAFVCQDIVMQMSGGPEGRGAEDGGRLSMPPLSPNYPDVPLWQTSTVQRVQALTQNFIGGLGYLACVYFGPNDHRTWRQHWEQVATDWNFDNFENDYGQLCLGLMDDTDTPSTGTVLRERIELGGVVDGGKVASDQIQNVEKYQYFFIPADEKYLSGGLEIRQAVSIAKYGVRERGQGQISSHLYTDDFATARDAASRYVADRAIGPAYPAVFGRLKRMLPMALGQTILAQHSDLSSTGAVPIYIRERIISPSAGTITLRGRSRVGTFAALVGAADAPNFALATPEERASLFFIADADGLLPDGSFGSRLR